ncbi:MAG: hypothetical protein ACE5GE_12985, partial [Phycisphaerae bacterium]
MGDDVKQLMDRLQDLLAHADDGPLTVELERDRPEDVAEVFELLDDQQRSRVLFALPPRAAAEVVAWELDRWAARARLPGS